MNEKEKAFVRDAIGDGPGLDIVQWFIRANCSFMLALEGDSYCLQPLGPGDRVYLRNVREEDMLVVQLLDSAGDDPSWAVDESNEGGGR